MQEVRKKRENIMKLEWKHIKRTQQKIKRRQISYIHKDIHSIQSGARHIHADLLTA